MADLETRCSVTVISSVLSELAESPELIGSIDQGTSSSRFIIFTKRAEILAMAQVEHEQIFPPGEEKVGWHEHDPSEIWSRVRECIDAVDSALKCHPVRSLDLSRTPLKAVGITNQRETTVAWNARTGEPYGNAIVWDDTRTTHIAHQIGNASDKGIVPLEEGISPQDRLRSKTGLPLAGYFAGTKVRWLLENIPQLWTDIQADSPERENVRFGTMDTWIVYQLTGCPGPAGSNIGGKFLTDVTNASRWLFMDIHTLEWDPELIRTVTGVSDLPLSCLPHIRSSSEVYGTCSQHCGIQSLSQVPIGAILGDQQAALFGQAGYRPGDAKCTYGTGLFLMMNTGGTPVPSTNGLLTTVAYKVGKNPAVYALEGSVSHSGSVLQWLRDQLQIVSSYSEVESFAKQTPTNDGLYFVPAFSGLFAPYWRSDARGCIVGMTASHNRYHFCRAALEASCYQSRALFEAIYKDSKTSLASLKVDGGGVVNSTLMQFQADMIDAPVVLPVVKETTCLGVAYAAGLAVGVYEGFDEIQNLWAVQKTWEPSMDATTREKYWKGWQKAVTRSFGWVEE